MARARGAELGTNARITGRELTVGERREIRANRGVERGRTALVERVVDAALPRDVRSEARGAPEVEGHVHAEPARLGHRVDEVPERRGTREREVVALREMLARNGSERNAAQRTRDARRAEAGRVHDGAGAHRSGLAAAEGELEAVFADGAAGDGGR